MRAMSDPCCRLRIVKELLTSAGAQARLSRAREWLAARGRALVVGATQEAAADLTREAAQRVAAAVGWQRFTLGRLAAVVATEAQAACWHSPRLPRGIEAS